MATVDHYIVMIVVDPNYGAMLSKLPIGIPVWVADTPGNERDAKRIWQERQGTPSDEGLTTFTVAMNETPDQWCANILQAVDLHHGEYSHDPPYYAVEVIGTEPSELLRRTLAKYGLTVITSNSSGFIASKAAV